MTTTLNGVFSALSTYITNLTTPSSSSLTDQTNAITSVNTSVKNVYDVISNPVYQSIITDQERTKNILASQTAFLNDLTDSNSTATETERRAIQQNLSHKRKYARYNAILITLSISFVICGIFMAIKKNAPFPIISQGCLASIILILTYDVIYITNSFLDIQKRDRSDFDKIDSDAAGLPSKTQLDALQSASSLSASTNTTCVGNLCCPSGYSWNSSTNICSLLDNSTLVPTDFIFQIAVGNNSTMPTTTTGSSNLSITNVGIYILTLTGTRAKAFAFSSTNKLSLSYKLPSAFTKTFWISTQTATGNIFGNSSNDVYFADTKVHTISTSSTTPPATYGSSHHPTDGSWVFYAIIQTATTISLYQNAGTLLKTNTYAWAGDTSAVTINIGGTKADYNFTGYMDDIRLYGRALSVEEISAIYAAR